MKVEVIENGNMTNPIRVAIVDEPSPYSRSLDRMFSGLEKHSREIIIMKGQSVGRSESFTEFAQYINSFPLVTKKNYEKVLEGFNLKNYSVTEQIYNQYWIKVSISRRGNNYLKVKKAIKTIEQKRGCGIDVKYFLNTRQIYIIDGKIKMCYNGK